MRRMAFIALAVALFALPVFGQAAWAMPLGGELDIACEGIESTGGGATLYQYTVHNGSPSVQTLTDLYVGTQDRNPANYSAWAMPATFVVAIAPNTFPLSTHSVKTAHGLVPSVGSWYSCQALVHWSSTVGLILGPGQTATFGFNHPGCSQDVGWKAFHNPGGSSDCNAALPIAGGLGVFTQGYVHGPNPVVPATTNWGLIVLVGLLVAVPVWLMVRRRRSVLGTA